MSPQTWSNFLTSGSQTEDLEGAGFLTASLRLGTWHRGRASWHPVSDWGPDTGGGVPDIRGSERLGNWYKRQGFSWVEERIPGAAWRQGKVLREDWGDPEGGLLEAHRSPPLFVGAGSPWGEKSSLGLSDFLTCGSQRDWGLGVRSRASGRERTESRSYQKSR